MNQITHPGSTTAKTGLIATTALKLPHVVFGETLESLGRTSGDSKQLELLRTMIGSTDFEPDQIVDLRRTVKRHEDNLQIALDSNRFVDIGALKVLRNLVSDLKLRVTDSGDDDQTSSAGNLAPDTRVHEHEHEHA